MLTAPNCWFLCWYHLPPQTRLTGRTWQFGGCVGSDTPTKPTQLPFLTQI